MLRSPRVLLKSLGCRLNEAEIESWARDFLARGWSIAGDGEAADLVVANSCAVTQEAARKSRQLLRRCQRANPHAKLVMTGCLASLNGPTDARELGADLLIDNRDKDRLADIAITEFDLPTMPETAIDGTADSLFARGRQRAFVKVQDGCRYACTFCVTCIARGKERSRPIDEVADLVARLAAAGIREALLAGVHLGGYGSDLGADIVALTRAVLERTSMQRIRLGSLEPWDLPPGFWSLFEDERLMPHLHLPLQSGSDRVLKRMARRCKSADFARLAEEGRQRVPALNLTTDIIVGFPGETDVDWQQTLRLVESLGLGDIHIFSYSARPGTRAAELPARVPEPVKRERAQELAYLAQRLRVDAMTASIGRSAAVLREAVSRFGPPDRPFGYTPDYFPTLLPPGDDSVPVGEILDVEIECLAPGGEALIARPVASGRKREPGMPRGNGKCAVESATAVSSKT